MHIFDYIFLFIAWLILILTYIPLLKSPKWYIRVWDYPRFQAFGIVIFLGIFGLNFCMLQNPWVSFTLIALGLTLIYLLWIILPYTALYPKMVEQERNLNPQGRIKLMTCNVYQENRQYKKALEVIQKESPDVIFLLETDHKWKNGVQSLKKDYKHFIEVPIDNTYGLLFYSKFPFSNEQILYLIDDEIPSIQVDLHVHDEIIRLYGIHPTPPVPQENEESTERDAEILIVGKKSKDFKGPSIVFGDLNDVAWSHTTRLFLRISKMLDPRIGRGMYNSFHAHYPLMRWPLDHVFVSSHFRVINMHVGEDIGSDHFPICISLAVRKADREKELEATTEDKQEAQEIIQEAKEN